MRDETNCITIRIPLVLYCIYSVIINSHVHSPRRRVRPSHIGQYGAWQTISLLALRTKWGMIQRREFVASLWPGGSRSSSASDFAWPKPAQMKSVEKTAIWLSPSPQVCKYKYTSSKIYSWLPLLICFITSRSTLG